MNGVVYLWIRYKISKIYAKSGEQEKSIFNDGGDTMDGHELDAAFPLTSVASSGFSTRRLGRMPVKRLNKVCPQTMGDEVQIHLMASAFVDE